MKSASGLAKNITARATSTGRPIRPTGIERASCSSFGLPCGITSWNMSLSTGPGATTLTVMPWLAVSSAQVRAMPSMPDFVAE